MIYAISFRITHEGNWSDRWSSLIERIHAQAGGADKTWEETTSFCVIESQLSAGGLADDLYFQTLLLPTDTLVVVNLSVKAHACYGAFQNKPLLDYLMGRR